MPKAYFSEAAISSIKGFIRAYEEAFFELYKDSGLVDEQAIVANYRLSAKTLNDQIFTKIERLLAQRKVLGRKDGKEWRELSFYVGTRLITVYYSELSGERVIEAVGIERKPIIF